MRVRAPCGRLPAVATQPVPLRLQVNFHTAGGSYFPFTASPFSYRLFGALQIGAQEQTHEHPPHLSRCARSAFSIG